MKNYPPDPLPTRPLDVTPRDDATGPEGPKYARLRLTPPGPGFKGWVLSVTVGEEQGVFMLAPAPLRDFLAKVAATKPGDDGKVELTVGRLVVTVGREQWPRVQDYFSMFHQRVNA